MLSLCRVSQFLIVMLKVTRPALIIMNLTTYKTVAKYYILFRLSKSSYLALTAFEELFTAFTALYIGFCGFLTGFHGFHGFNSILKAFQCPLPLFTAVDISNYGHKFMAFTSVNFHVITSLVMIRRL
jgi:hypothetical protein